MLLAEVLLSPSGLAAIAGVGLMAGVLGGLLGIGGGLVMIPALLLILGEPFGPGSLHLYKLAALAAAAVLSLVAARRHARAGAIVWRVVPWVVAGAVLGVIGGVLLGGLFVGEQTRVLRRVFGGFMLVTVASQVWRQRTADRDGGVSSCPLTGGGRYAGWVGLPAGLIGGLLGVGGGVWAVPVQHFVFGIQMRSAIANSSCMIVGVSIAAAIGLSVSIGGMADLRVMDGWLLAAGLAPGALLGGWIGGGLTHRVRTDWLRVGFQVLLVVTGLKLLAG